MPGNTQTLRELREKYTAHTHIVAGVQTGSGAVTSAPPLDTGGGGGGGSEAGGDTEAKVLVEDTGPQPTATRSLGFFMLR